MEFEFVGRAVPPRHGPSQKSIREARRCDLPRKRRSPLFQSSFGWATRVGILNEIDKFNNALNVFSERRKTAKGEEVAVETVYIGLGAAYFVNDSGDFAGMGAPGANGWEWSLRPELGPAVKEVLKIYRNERTAQFVTLPVVIH